ncbi:MAG: glutamate racemase [Clostridiales bacterium]|nr:glutamate racemase [Clostridiales bacterium]
MGDYIGFFDSGLGGISILKEAVRILPHESFLYYGDNANAPYGVRSSDDITALTLSALRFLVSQGVKALVIACNTATATCINTIRSEFSLPVISVEPAVKPAALQPGNGKILMLATPITVKHDRYLSLQNRMPDPDRIINVSCPELVDRIEQGIFTENGYDDILDRCLFPWHNKTIDSIVLGCTHFMFIKQAIVRYAAMHFSGAATIYDSSKATALQLARVLQRHGISAPAEATGTVVFHTSGDISRLMPLFLKLLEQK